MHSTTAGLAVHVHLPGRTVPATLTTDHPASSYGQPVLMLEGGPSHGDQPVPYGPGDVTRWGPAACLLLEGVQTDADGPEEGPTVLDRWNGLSEGLRAQGRLPSMAENFLEAGEWDDGTTWHQGERSLVDELDRAPLDRTTVRHLVEAPLLRTRIPEGRKVEGLEYGGHFSRPGWSGYYVRAGDGPWAVARLTPAEDETYPTDTAILAAIREELAGAGVECAAWTFPDGSGVVEVGETWDVFSPDGRTGAGEVVR